MIIKGISLNLKSNYLDFGFCLSFKMTNVIGFSSN